MFKFIVLILLIFSIYKWFVYSMAFKGLMYYVGTHFGEDEMDKIDMRKVIQTAIKNTLNDLRG